MYLTIVTITLGQYRCYCETPISHTNRNFSQLLLLYHYINKRRIKGTNEVSTVINFFTREALCGSLLNM